MPEFMVGVRRRIHRRPELAYREYETSAAVADYLKEFGYSVRRGVAGTGVVGERNWGQEGGIILTADMDALSISEQNEVPYRSEIEGVMHACGHDGHTAALLGASWKLAESELPLRVVFRPAEEDPGEDPQDRNGMEYLIEEGAFDGARAVIGFHIDAARRFGEFLVPDGPVMSGIDNYCIEITGISHHRAYPHEGCDPVWLGTFALNRLYSIAHRDVSPRNMMALDVGQVHTVDDPQAPKLVISGSVRTNDVEAREQIFSAIRSIGPMISALGGQTRIDITQDTPTLLNDVHLAQLARSLVAEQSGEGALAREQTPETGSDDFAFVESIGVPALYFLVGGFASEESCHHHHPQFDFDEAVLTIIANFLVSIAQKLGDA